MNSQKVISGNGSLERASDYFSLSRFSSMHILADTNTSKYCVPILIREIPLLKQAQVITVAAGDHNKTIETVESIVGELLNSNADRKSLLINAGGGMITDLGGFTASVFKRGIKFVNIPTSLMAMADASIGGKTGVNIRGIKNVVGTFNLPDAVFIHAGFLQTLPERELKSAYAEIIKHILLSDKVLWEKVTADPARFFSPENIPALIEHSVNFKNSVVNSDFKDEGRRHILNLGHTLGHAIESYLMDSPWEILHGEAIAAGLLGELFLSSKSAGLGSNVLSEAVLLMKSIFPDLKIICSPEKLLPILQADKKNNLDSIGFSLLHSPGQPAQLSYPEKDLIIESIIFMTDAFRDKEQFVSDEN